MKILKTKITDLEHLCNEVSKDSVNKSYILFTPKFHCELAGEGIEYSWGASKRLYRKQPISKKISIANFLSLVKQCIDYITPMMATRFSAHARGYMLGYLHKKITQEDEDHNSKVKTEWLFSYNEKIHKIYRNHRDANIIEGSYIEAVMRECIGISRNKQE